MTQPRAESFALLDKTEQGVSTFQSQGLLVATVKTTWIPTNFVRLMVGWRCGQGFDWGKKSAKNLACRIFYKYDLR